MAIIWSHWLCFRDDIQCIFLETVCCIHGWAQPLRGKAELLEGLILLTFA